MMSLCSSRLPINFHSMADPELKATSATILCIPQIEQPSKTKIRREFNSPTLITRLTMGSKILKYVLTSPKASNRRNISQVLRSRFNCRSFKPKPTSSKPKPPKLLPMTSCLRQRSSECIPSCTKFNSSKSCKPYRSRIQQIWRQRVSPPVLGLRIRVLYRWETHRHSKSVGY